MASNLLTGDRRWGSTRRGGMTVLGKVAVPKPVNLPSQRLENHGLDPNVEIVPKGTLSWGSSALSPRSSDGVAGSPSHINGRPSSSGNGTRPTTAGSDRSYEPPNAWGPNCRPSSSSGVLASNQTSMVTTRPRSAETRPASSQLSRFAEPSSENSVAWGASGTAEKLGSASSKVNRFTLSSGDFPTLGSEKNECPGQKGHSLEGRPVSASGRVSTPKEGLGPSPDHEPINVNAEGDTANNWTGDKSPFVGDGAPPSTEKWQREPQPFPNITMPPQHLDHWHGAPVRHSSEGVWYRGPPGGPPYGTPGPPGPPGPPGGYPIEPNYYYHPQAPPRPLPNAQTVPRPGPGPGPSNYHPKNADSYRPQIPESYMRPMMPMRPGVYPGMVPYEGYYGPPLMAMCNSGDRDAPPVLGMAAGPCVYNRFPSQNLHHDSGNYHARPGGYGSSSNNMMNERVEHSHSHGAQRGPYKVLLKQQDAREEKDREDKGRHAIPTNAPLEGVQPQRASVGDDWETDNRKDKTVDLLKTVSGEEASSQSRDYLEVSSVPVGKKVPGIMSGTMAINDSSVKKKETAPIPGSPQQFPPTKRNPSLMDKIEGLNTKARISEGRYDGGSISNRDEKMKRSRVGSGNVNHSVNEAVSDSGSAEKPNIIGKPTLSPQEYGTSAVVFGVSESQASVSDVLNISEVGEEIHGRIHKGVHVQNRVDSQGKGRFTKGGEEWRNKAVAKSSNVIPGANTETSDADVQGFGAHQKAPEKSNSDIHGRSGAEFETSSFDPNDYNEQRAKMKEIATQRVKQLQKEEEERTREQKAKALAKLEELNRRTQAESSTQKKEEQTREQKDKPLTKLEEFNRRTQAESSTQKLDDSLPLSCSIPQNLEGSMSHVEVCNSREAPGSSLGGNASAFSQDSDRLGGSNKFFRDVISEASKCAPQGSVELRNSSVPLPQDINSSDAGNPKPAQPSPVPQIISSRQKQVGHRKRLNIPSDKNFSEKPTPTGNNGASRSPVHMVPDVGASKDGSSPPNIESVDDCLPSQKRKAQRNGKSKRKLEEASSGALNLSIPTEENPGKIHVDIVNAKASEASLGVSSVNVVTSKDSAEVQDSQCVPSEAQAWSTSTEEAHGRANNQWRPQSRRMPRNQQAIRPVDKYHGGEAVVWAPVRSQNKNEAPEGANPSNTSEANASSTKNGQGIQSNMIKGKRAELERYVPKPAAKEMSQQCSTERPSSPIISQSIPDEAQQRIDSGSQGTEGGYPAGLAMRNEHKNGGSRHKQHGKAHGSWRQRGSTEPPLQGSQEESLFSSGTGKNGYKPIEKHQLQEWEACPPKEPERCSDQWTSSNTVSTDQVLTGFKDHNVMGKGKRHQPKGQKGTVHDRNVVDQKGLNGGGADKIDIQTSALEASQAEGRVVRENPAGEHSTSQWQPKSQPHVSHNRQNNRVDGSQKDTVSKTSGKEFTHHDDGYTSQSVKDQVAFLDQPQPHQSETLKAVAEGSTVRREVKKERKGAGSFKRAPNQDLVNQSEVRPANVDTQLEQQSSSGFRRHGHPNDRFSRMQESTHAVRNSVGQESSKQHHTMNSEKRQNLHYEYQPVGSHNNKQDSSERATDGSRATSSRYRERGPNHPRRAGNFSARSSGTVGAADGYGNER